MNAQTTQMMRLMPTLPVSRSVPCGEMKIPDPTCDPTISAIPPMSPTPRFMAMVLPAELTSEDIEWVVFRLPILKVSLEN